MNVRYLHFGVVPGRDGMAGVAVLEEAEGNLASITGNGWFHRCSQAYGDAADVVWCIRQRCEKHPHAVAQVYIDIDGDGAGIGADAVKRALRGTSVSGIPVIFATKQSVPPCLYLVAPAADDMELCTGGCLALAVAHDVVRVLGSGPAPADS